MVQNRVAIQAINIVKRARTRAPHRERGRTRKYMPHKHMTREEGSYTTDTSKPSRSYRTGHAGSGGWGGGGNKVGGQARQVVASGMWSGPRRVAAQLRTARRASYSQAVSPCGRPALVRGVPAPSLGGPCPVHVASPVRTRPRRGQRSAAGSRPGRPETSWARAGCGTQQTCRAVWAARRGRSSGVGGQWAA